MTSIYTTIPLILLILLLNNIIPLRGDLENKIDHTCKLCEEIVHRIQIKIQDSITSEEIKKL